MNEYRLRVKVQTPDQGDLVGDWSDSLTTEEAAEIKDIFKKHWESLTYLSLVINRNDIIVPVEMLRRSVTTLEVTRLPGILRLAAALACLWKKVNLARS